MENKKNRHLTIMDIAKLADVSMTTVSRVINGSDNVSVKTRAKVLDVIRSVDYIPNEIARGLATNSNNVIGLLIPDIMNGYYSELIRSIESTISAQSFSLLLCITNAKKEKEEYYINDMIRRRTSGLIILSTKIDSKALLKRMLSTIEVISVDADIPGVDRIYTESENGTYEVVKHLLNNGHRKIGFIGYQFYLSSLKRRLDGYCRALEEFGVPVRQEYIIEGSPTGNPGYLMTQQLLSLSDPPTAIHCINEYCATSVYRALMEKGMKIPDDISVTAFDGLESSKLLLPKLTTAIMPIADMGTAAAELLIQNILEKKIGAQKSYLFPVEIEIGDSVKKLN